MRITAFRYCRLAGRIVPSYRRVVRATIPKVITPVTFHKALQCSNMAAVRSLLRPIALFRANRRSGDERDNDDE
jgi:hypothetical protein